MNAIFLVLVIAMQIATTPLEIIPVLAKTVSQATRLAKTRMNAQFPIFVISIQDATTPLGIILVLAMRVS
jgi:hypothetical protein